ncbi:hypothetical protein [Bradyrhizobium sp. LHD-71]|uniref:hypothetical protein n=1 Tax=Bradyrhizobium sp. LHD-71 TaxID=3072141 RepID=UPI00280C868C|nr:hypothetical protein [Bradyrhizobium sp. LHD-71]MDQ8732406.1 hypothetical protein [Bradyrhizobium sp. LHD-71]
MANHTPVETTQWVAEALRKTDEVSNVDVLDDQVLRVERTKYAPFVAGIVSKTRVHADDIRPLVESTHGVEIIANVPKEAVWTGDAIRLAQNNSVATGVFGDLYRVLGESNVRGFQQREIAFIERGLRQHDRVTSFERDYDKVYRLSRKGGLPDLTAAMLNEYELTTDHIRTARDRYGKFDVAVNTNPNGTITRSALDAANAMGIEILKWGPFFGRINKK